MTSPIKVGFWYSLQEHHLPQPQHHVDTTWDPAERDIVIAYIKKGLRGSTYRGFSRCRFCQCPNGSSDQTDGTYIWPSGFAHYLEVHHVKPPQKFIDHVLKKVSQRVAV